MPPRTRTAKSTKGMKENIVVGAKTKQKHTAGKDTRSVRKVLADKTNSASDDNASIEAPKKVVKKPSVVLKTSKLQKANDNTSRPQRDRRLPNRFVENKVLKNLSNSKENLPTTTPDSKKNETQTPVKKNSIVESPFKTPQKVTETSLIASRPRRVCRLPSKFDDHSISPNKFIPVQPSHASTPLAQKNVITPNSNSRENKNNVSDKATPKAKPCDASSNKKAAPKKVSKKVLPDTNNNGNGRTLRTRKVVHKEENQSSSLIYSSEKKIKSPVKTSPIKKSPKKPVNKNYSFKVLEDNKKNKSNQDVYEFTYDPNEEPPPQKKKKKVVRRKPAKPKTVILKNNYDINVSKALTALKNVVAKKQAGNALKTQTPMPIKKGNNAQELQKTVASMTDKDLLQVQQRSANVNIISVPQVQRNVASKIIISGTHQQKIAGSSIKNNAQGHQIVQTGVKNIQPTANVISVQDPTKTERIPEQHKSIRVEDIAADFEPSLHDDIDYSPVNSPKRPKTPVLQQNNTSAVHTSNDPLNLRENLSFFEENPVASSSMNTSVRHPLASPWRVEFGNLPIRWHVNSYVKANMTPAVECSFVNFEDKNKKKHVYTNLVPESNDSLPEIVQKDQPNLIQTSMISFIKEVMELSSSKKKRSRSVTPVTASLFNDTANKSATNNLENVNKTSRQLFTPKKNTDMATSDNLATKNVKNTSNDKENSEDSSKGKKRKNDADPNVVPAKTPRNENDITFFGFDDSENQDQENVSPQKIVEGRKRGLRPRARAVLKEINEQTGPTRALIPVAAKTAGISEVEKLYDQMKSATDAPVFPDKEPVNIEATNVNETVEEVLNEDSQSVHLFEDIEVVHHLKPQRKSYGKAKKVTFRQHSSDSDTQTSNPRAQLENSDAEDMDDITFDPGVPFVEQKKTKKKQTKKQKLSKKEKEEADAWAANFNSMCEDVDEFPLIVE